MRELACPPAAPDDAEVFVFYFFVFFCFFCCFCFSVFFLSWSLDHSCLGWEQSLFTHCLFVFIPGPYDSEQLVAA